jgi:hypothetical protein
MPAGYDYILPQEQYQQPQSRQATGPQRAQQAYQEGLLGLEDDVKGYYKDYNSLNQFAHGMWENAGIDVTAPDPSNPASIDAYNMYLQGMSQVQEKGNRMRNRQELFKAGYLESLRNPDVRFTEGMEQETFDPTQDITNIAPGTMAKAVMNRYGRSVKSKQEEAQLKAYKQEALDELNAQFEEATDPREQRQIKAQIDAIEAIQPTYDASFDNELAARERMARARATGDKKVYISTRWNEVARVQQGGKGMFQGMLDSKGNQIFEDVIYSPANGQMILRPQGKAEPIYIDLKADDGGARQINSIYNKFSTDPDEKMAWDELEAFGRENNIVLPTGINSALMNYDVTGINKAQDVLTNSSDKKHSALINRFATLAQSGKLVFPDFTVTVDGDKNSTSGMFGLKLSNIELSRSPWKTAASLGMAGGERLRVYDQEGNEFKIDPNDPSHQKWIDEFLKVNSGVVDFLPLSKTYRRSVIAKAEETGKVAMEAPNGTIVAVDPSRVEEFTKKNGYNKVTID